MKKIVAVITVFLVCALALCACTPNSDKLEKKFRDKGYQAERIRVYDLGDAEIEYSFSATKGHTSNIIVVCFKKGSDATEYYNEIKKNADNKEVAKKGNAVAVGTEDAIKIFK